MHRMILNLSRSITFDTLLPFAVKSLRDISKSPVRFFGSQNMRFMAIKNHELTDPIKKPEFVQFYESAITVDNRTFEEWMKFEEEAVNLKYSRINVEQFPGYTMKMFLRSSQKNFKLCSSFVDYVKKTRGELNIFTVCAYIGFCGECVDECGEDLILDLYDEIVARGRLLDSVATDMIIRGLCSTKFWMKSTSLMENLKKHTCPSFTSYNKIVETSFKNDEPEIGWKYMDEMIGSDFIPNDDTLCQIVDYCKKLQPHDTASSESEMFKLLNYFRDQEYAISSEICKKICDYFLTLPGKQWIYKWVSIRYNGKCHGCGNSIQTSDISSEQMKLLQKQCSKDLLISSDVFLNTKPDEVEKFFEFIEKEKPFDIVIDGLNVAHMHSRNNNAKNLYEVVKYFVEQENKKVLVTGRKHMLKWPQLYISYITSKAKVFFSSNISKDDPFLLLSTLISGPGTVVMTSDLLRDHIFKLKDENVNKVFRMWLRSHQVYYRGKKDGKPLLQPLIKHLQEVEIRNDGKLIHIPYDDHTKIIDNQLHDKWLCLCSK